MVKELKVTVLVETLITSARNHSSGLPVSLSITSLPHSNPPSKHRKESGNITKCSHHVQIVSTEALNSASKQSQLPIWPRGSWGPGSREARLLHPPFPSHNPFHDRGHTAFTFIYPMPGIEQKMAIAQFHTSVKYKVKEMLLAIWRQNHNSLGQT